LPSRAFGLSRFRSLEVGARGFLRGQFVGPLGGGDAACRLVQALGAGIGRLDDAGRLAGQAAQI
jgi:hypothetical protein